jgi:uncharacterized repeat protein (TIGR04076 family)
MLEITVHEIRGTCPVHSVGDRIIVDGPTIVVAESDALCTHALSTLLHYTTILEHTWCPVALGLTTSEDPRTPTCSASIRGRRTQKGARSSSGAVK